MMGESTGLPPGEKHAHTVTIPGEERESSTFIIHSNLKNDQRTKNYSKSLFEKYDTDENGRIDVKELAAMLRENHEISDELIRKLLAKSDKNQDGKIDVDEFTTMILDRKLKTVFEKYAKMYFDLIEPQNHRHRDYTPPRKTSLEGGGEEVNRADSSEGSCYPPPLCMVLVSIIEIICYVLNQHLTVDQKRTYKSPTEYATEGPVARYLIYIPHRRQECWRYLTYMMVHLGWTHLAVNLIIQIFFGMNLERINRWWRVLLVYITGVVAGSLVTSITDPKVYLAGASGGAYAIAAGYLANLILNWNDMYHSGVQLSFLLILVSLDMSSAIYNRYVAHDSTPVGYAAHLGGALAGLLVGIWVLKNIKLTAGEKYLLRIAFVIYILFMGTAVVLNIVR